MVAKTATATTMQQTLTVTMTSSEGWDRSFPYHVPSSSPHAPRDLHERALRKSKPADDKKNDNKKNRVVATAVFSGSDGVPDLTGYVFCGLSSRKLLTSTASG